MTRVCLVGDDDVQLRYELLSKETARAALRTQDLRTPFANTVGLETVSLGAAVSLLNDLNWYIVRFVETALVLEPSVSEHEWLSRELATSIRDDEIRPDETGRLLKVYGIERPGESGPPENSESSEDGDSDSRPAGDRSEADGRPKLVEPMYLTRTDDRLPEYDIRDVDDTLLVRITEREFEQG
jgi:hypothetical protein